METEKYLPTRRSFLRGALAVGAGAAAIGITGCSNSADAATGNQGTSGNGAYVGSAPGFRDEVTAFIAVEDGRITSVVPGSNRETTGPGSDALARLSKRMVEHQSVNLDTITGATLTSMGFLAAAKGALSEAGMLEKFNQKVIIEPPAHDDEEYDIIVVGAGGSGLMAALTAKYPTINGIPSKTKVLVVEKLDIIGGSARLSGGGLAVADGTSANDLLNIHNTGADMAEILTRRSNQEAHIPFEGGIEVNMPLVERMSEYSGMLWTKIAEWGGPTITGLGGKGSYVTLTNRNNVQLLDPEGKPKPNKAYYNEGGSNLASYLNSKVLESGTEIRTGTRVVKLNTANGAVTGVRVSEGGNEYDIKAKKVILSCGGFGNNPDMLKEMCPEYENIKPYCTAGNTGDGFTLTEEFGLQKVGKGLLGYFGADQRWGITTALGKAIQTRPNMLVTIEGKRTFSEPDIDNYIAAEYVATATGGKMVGICDSSSEMAAIMEEDALPFGRGYKADTLEELASMAGVEPDGLLGTVEAYNAAFDAGKEAEFGTPHEKLSPVMTPPFYAYDVVPLTIGTLVGFKVDENCQFLNKNNEPIANLYGTGEMIMGGNVLSRLYLGGMCLFTALTSGYIAATHASANL